VSATVPSKGSTNQSDFAFDEMVSTFLSSMCQSPGLFCQLSVSGRPAIEGVVCPKAGAELSHRKIPEKTQYLAMRPMFFSFRSRARRRVNINRQNKSTRRRAAANENRARLARCV
jgi:hypothetical protein